MSFLKLFCSVLTFDDTEFSAYPALETAIKLREDNLCSPVRCDPTYPWRHLDGSCNNLDNPRWGSANVAQNRLIPAEWETGKTANCNLHSSFGHSNKIKRQFKKVEFLPMTTAVTVLSQSYNTTVVIIGFFF